MARKPDGVGREKVRARLGLAVWEVELAADTGLLNRLDDRSFDPVSVGAAESDPEGFRARLALERRCNATEAAARLGVSVERFKRVADAAGLVPVAEEEVRKYGRVLRVRYWRAGDVDELADHVRADEELRAAVVAAGRRAAARKAVATRRRNAEAAKVARAEVEFRRPGDEAGPVEVLAWAVALARAAGTWPGGLRRWRHADDPLVDEFADLLRRARFGRDVLEGLFEDVRARAVEAGESLVPARAVAAKLGGPIECIEVRVPHLGGHVPGSRSWPRNRRRGCSRSCLRTSGGRRRRRSAPHEPPRLPGLFPAQRPVRSEFRGRCPGMSTSAPRPVPAVARLSE